MLHAELETDVCLWMLSSHYKGISEDRIEVLAKEIFDDILIDAIFPGAKDLINLCKSDQRVVLVTGSLDVTIAVPGRISGADDFIASRLELKMVLLPASHASCCSWSRRYTIVEDAKKHGYDLSMCHGYSDSYSDVPMLSVVGQAFSSTPTKNKATCANIPLADHRYHTGNPGPK